MLTRIRSLRARSAAALVTTAALLGGGLVAAAPAAQAEGSVTLQGRGFGHGRGMGQYGSYGYAVDYGWSYQRILDHYYGGTRLATDAGNPEISVELLAQRSKDLIVTGPALLVDGAATQTAAVLFRRVAAGRFQAYTGPGCGGPWTVFGPARTSGTTVRTAASPADTRNLLRLCEPGRTRAYRGALSVMEGGSRQNVVNRVPLNEYLRSVVPAESPASWGSAGGGRGMEALKAQTVAARSYAMSSAWTAYAQTCDTTSCQVYRGAYLLSSAGARTPFEFTNTDLAVAATSDQVRRWPDGRIVRAEFSSSTGGWTAGGDFPAVQDLGDGTTANPNRAWTATFSFSQLASRLGTPAVTGITVTRRNGLGADGGRVLEVAVDTVSGRRTLSGGAVRSALGLKSDWFTVPGFPNAEARAYVTALYTDVLGRSPDAGGLNTWTQAVATGTPTSSVAATFAGSPERLQGMVVRLYRAALVRSPDSGGVSAWAGVLQRGTYADVAAGVYGSPESLFVLGRGDVRAWVDGLYRGELGRAAGVSERGFWAAQAAARGRAAVARDIAQSVEARTLRLSAMYTSLLGRGVDSGGLGTFLPAMLGRGHITVVTSLASSPEFWLRAQGRY